MNNISHYIHNIDPIIFTAGPLSVRWYGMMYLLGFVLSFFYLRRKHRQGLWALNSLETQDLITYLLAGMLIGARGVYVLIYNPEMLSESIWNAFKVWEGGLSYHGAVLGFTGAMMLFARKNGYQFLHVADYVCTTAGIGVFFGRIGNFINGELWGRTTDVPWGVIFEQTGGGSLARHPSQLYQALCEGLIVFAILIIAEKMEVKKGFAPEPVNQDNYKDAKKQKNRGWKRTGVLGSIYLILYGVARFAIEFFREPDAQLGYYFGWMTMGQILCAIMIIVGTIVLIRRIKKPIPQEIPVK